jgi:large subunit ribosomal protein L5
MATTQTPARLKTRYRDEIRPALIERFGYTSSMQAPEIQKITLNMGVGDAKQDSKALDAAQQQLAAIAGQQPSIRRARKSIAAFKLREGMPVGVAVTLRRERAYEFLDRLMSVAIPRIRDFRGLNPRSFDGHGNYSMGVREQIIFPEVDYDEIDQIRGLDITITTNAASDVEAFALLEMFGMPFSREHRPAEFGSGGTAEEASGRSAPVEEDEPEVAEEPDAAVETPEAEAVEEPEVEVAPEPEPVVETPEAPVEVPAEPEPVVETPETPVEVPAEPDPVVETPEATVEAPAEPEAVVETPEAPALQTSGDEPASEDPSAAEATAGEPTEPGQEG